MQQVRQFVCWFQWPCRYGCVQGLVNCTLRMSTWCREMFMWCFVCQYVKGSIRFVNEYVNTVWCLSGIQFVNEYVNIVCSLSILTKLKRWIDELIDIRTFYWHTDIHWWRTDIVVDKMTFSDDELTYLLTKWHSCLQIDILDDKLKSITS